MVGQRANNSGQLRIIGGQWRGRKLRFRARPGLRPTADGVRETLFNWLGTELPGARCLDLFAGSGALGLEALSRGATLVNFVERDRRAAAGIRVHLQTLACNGGRVFHEEAAHWLRRQDSQVSYNIAFLDPPFGEALLQPACQALEDRGLLSSGCHIYLESSKREPLPALPAHWRLHRDKQAGEVSYRLFVRGR